MTGADRVKVTPQGQPLTGYGVGSTYTSTDLIGATAAIEWTGTEGRVTGEIKNIAEPWTDFNAAGDNTGHFFPIELDQKYEGEKITVIGKRQKTVQDRYWVLRVENAKSNKFTFKKGDETLFTLDFSGAELN